MYHPLHEADESKFIEVLQQKLDALSANRPTRLRSMREAFGLSQSELAHRANVGLRAIQMYEQRNKDINHAQQAPNGIIIVIIIILLIICRSMGASAV